MTEFINNIYDLSLSQKEVWRELANMFFVLAGMCGTFGLFLFLLSIM